MSDPPSGRASQDAAPPGPTATRARTPEAKRARAAAILDALEDRLRDAPFTEVPVAGVAEGAGVAKGTVFLYFPTKEAMGLALAGRLLERWSGDLERSLAQADVPPGPEGPRSAARLLARSLDGHETLMDLLAVAGSVLPRDVDPDTLEERRAATAAALEAPARRLEGALPWLERGGGTALLRRVLALASGLREVEAVAPGEVGDGALEAALVHMLEGHRATVRREEAAGGHPPLPAERSPGSDHGTG